MACDIDDREGESPSPMEPLLGRLFHSSATGRRREQTLPEPLGLRQALHPRDDTAGSAGVRRGRPGALQPTDLRPRAKPGRATESATDRMRGDGRPSRNALPLKIFRRPQPPERRRTERRPKLAPLENAILGRPADAPRHRRRLHTPVRQARPGPPRQDRVRPVPPGRHPASRRSRRPVARCRVRATCSALAMLGANRYVSRRGPFKVIQRNLAGGQDARATPSRDEIPQDQPEL